MPSNEPSTEPSQESTSQFVRRHRWLVFSQPGVVIAAWPLSHVAESLGKSESWFGLTWVVALAFGVLGPGMYALFSIPLHFARGDRVRNPAALALAWLLFGFATDFVTLIATARFWLTSLP